MVGASSDVVFIALTLVTRLYLYSFLFFVRIVPRAPSKDHCRVPFILAVFGHSRWPPWPSCTLRHYYIWYSIIVSRDELVAINQEREHFCVAPQCDDSNTRGVTQNWQFWKRMNDHPRVNLHFSEDKGRAELRTSNGEKNNWWTFYPAGRLPGLIEAIQIQYLSVVIRINVNMCHLRLYRFVRVRGWHWIINKLFSSWLTYHYYVNLVRMSIHVSCDQCQRHLIALFLYISTD